MSIGSLLLRMAGRDPQGKARGLSVTENGELKTQVNGSKVGEPIELVSNLSVDAGASVNAVSTYEISDALGFFVGLSSDSASPRVTLEVQPVINGLVSSTLGNVKIVDNQALNNNRGISEKYEMATSIIRLRLTNHSDSTRVFTLHLYKTNGSGQTESLRQMEYFGATVDGRPLTSNVPIGAIYMAVNTQEVWQSNGTSWVVL